MHALLVLLAALSAGLALQDDPPDEGFADDVPDTVLLVDRNAFACTPEVVRPGMQLRLSKHDPALDELAVRRPGDDGMYFLVVWQPPEEMRPLMGNDALSAAREVGIDVDSLQGLDWSVGARPAKIFTREGSYEFVLSPALESEEGGFLCKVEYRP